MSTKYKLEKDVPTNVLCNRLEELSSAVTKGRAGIEREFYMSVPAQLDNDADLVISEAVQRLRKTDDNHIAKLVNELTEAAKTHCHAQSLRGVLSTIVCKHLKGEQ